MQCIHRDGHNRQHSWSYEVVYNSSNSRGLSGPDYFSFHSNTSESISSEDRPEQVPSTSYFFSLPSNYFKENLKAIYNTTIDP